MSETKKLILIVLLLVFVIAAGLFAYNIYKDKVNPDTGEITTPESTDASSITDTPEKTATPEATETAAYEDAAPDFTMEDANGNEVSLSDFEGTPVVLNFWTSWCGYCAEEMPSFETAYEEYGDKIQFIILNPVTSEESSTSGRDFIEDNGYTFPVFYDLSGDSLTLYGLRGFPTTVFINSDGNITYYNTGLITEDKLTENLDLLLED